MTDPSPSASSGARPSRPSRHWRASLLVTALLLVAGCGGDDGGERAKFAVCEDVPFTANSDDIAVEIRAAGVSCDEARSFVRDTDGAPGRESRGYACTSRQVEGETVLVHSVWRCGRGDAVITWKRF